MNGALAHGIVLYMLCAWEGATYHLCMGGYSTSIVHGKVFLAFVHGRLLGVLHVMCAVPARCMYWGLQELTATIQKRARNSSNHSNASFESLATIQEYLRINSNHAKGRRK